MLTQRLPTAGVLAALALVFGVVLVAGQQRGASTPSIVGVWRVSEVSVTGPNARKIASPQPGFRIFTQRHYSITEVTSDKPREVVPQGKATDKQLADAWGPFVANAGTYEIKGNEITTRLLAAKNPGAMQAGNFNTYTFALESNTLTITQKANTAGPIANPTTTKLTRVE